MSLKIYALQVSQNSAECEKDALPSMSFQAWRNVTVSLGQCFSSYVELNALRERDFNRKVGV